MNRFVLASFAATLLAACGGGQPGPVNPQTAASCAAEGDNGSRAGYHAAADSTWVPDCELPLGREYWRVFKTSESSAYVMPRPDGAAELAALCEADDAALREALDRATLCAANPDIASVNTMKPADAIRVARALHSKLRFRAEGGSVVPFAVPTDVADACAMGAPKVLNAACERAKNPGANEMAFAYTKAEAEALAPLLNRLYGIQ